MTEPVLTVNRVPVTESMKTHPLATQPGINMFVHLLEADMVWSGCTTPQRALLADLVPPVVDVTMAKDSLSVEDMPVLPERVTAASRAAMRKRGLVDDAGRLTACAVHAWFYAGRLKQADGDAS